MKPGDERMVPNRTDTGETHLFFPLNNARRNSYASGTGAVKSVPDSGLFWLLSGRRRKTSCEILFPFF